MPHIVVCGHTECGAMKGLMNPEGLDGLPHVSDWLGFAQPALAAIKERTAGKSEAEAMRLLLEQNVLVQLDHLKTHPSVAKRLKKGEVELHGWVYNIKTGAVDAYDPAQESFVPVGSFYGE